MSFGNVIRSAASPVGNPGGIGGNASVIWLSEDFGKGTYELSVSDFSVVRYNVVSADFTFIGHGGDSSHIWFTAHSTFTDRYGNLRDLLRVGEISVEDLSILRHQVEISYRFKPTWRGAGGDSSVVWSNDLVWDEGDYAYYWEIKKGSPNNLDMIAHFRVSGRCYGLGGTASTLWWADQSHLRELNPNDGSILEGPVSTVTGKGVGGDDATIWRAGDGHVYEIAAVVSPPQVATHEATDITSTSAVGHGEITNTGVPNPVERGFEWGTESGVYPHSVTEAGTFGTGPFSLDLTGLPIGTTVYYRAKARNSAGWGYGGEQSFIPCDPAEVMTETPTNIGPTSVTARGYIRDTGEYNCDEVGFDVGMSPGSYTDHPTKTGDFGVGEFTIDLTGIPIYTDTFTAAEDNETAETFQLEYANITSVSWVKVNEITISPEEYEVDEVNGKVTLAADQSDVGDEVKIEYQRPVYYRAKAHNPRGWSYGDEVTFATGEAEVPEVTIEDPTDVKPTSLVAHGKVENTGGSDITQFGFQWGTQPGVYEKYVYRIRPLRAEPFEEYLAGLPLETTIYIRAVACNSAGCGYSEEISLGPPSVSTVDADPIHLTSAQGNGEITDIEGLAVDERGFDWGIEPGSTHSVTEEGSFGTGAYNLTLDGLPSHTTIYYRAKAHNPRGWGYGDVKTFFTVHKPKVSTIAIGESDTRADRALLAGSITNSGEEPCDIRGFDWGTESGVYPNSVTQKGSFWEGTFEIWATGLSPGTTIYYRAKAHNPAGWAFGSEHSVKTSQVPQVTTKDATEVGAIRAQLNGVIDGCSGEDCTGMAFEYGTSSCNPGEYPNTVSAGRSGEGYRRFMEGISPQTKYYYRFKAHNSAGWGYGDEVTFVTDPVVLPKVNIREVDDIRAFSAHVTGEVEYDGGENTDKCGFEWGLSSGEYPNSVEFDCNISTFHASTLSDVLFSRVLDGNLPQETDIYVRAKAHNRAGWGYGPEKVFTTRKHILPSVSTVGATNVNEVSATLSGRITDDGGWDCYERGFEWGTESGNYSNHVTEEGTYRTGEFSTHLTGLPSHVTIYYRAMARNGIGWAYGDEKTFVTEYVPVVETDYPSNITLEGEATARGDIIDIGVERCDKRGFEWGESPGNLTHEILEEGSFGEGDFSLPMTDLPTCTLLYYRAKAHNPTGWGYGPVIGFWTFSRPSVQTLNTFDWPLYVGPWVSCYVPGISTTGARLRAEIVGTGGLRVDEMGIEWGTSPDALDNSITDTGNFPYEHRWEKWVDALPDCTHIYYRAKAHNACGWSYGGIKGITIGYPPRLSQKAWLQYEYYGDYWWKRHCTYATKRVFLKDCGCGSVDKMGIEWGTESGVYTRENVKEGSFVGGFHSFDLDDLPVNTRIYFRGKAHNHCGWGYERELSFVTGNIPSVSTDETPSDQIRALHAIAHMTITSTGIHPYLCDKIGFEWSTTPGPPYEHEVTRSGSFYQRGHYGEGSEAYPGTNSMELTLPSDTTIYYRAKAHNDGGWGYGQERSLTTPPLYLPEVSTGDASDITAHTAVVEGEVTDWGNEYCDECGIEWGTESGNYPNSATEAGEFASGDVYTVLVKGMPSSTTIYYRAIAHNPKGWNHATNEKTLTTKTVTPPDASTGDPQEVTEDTATPEGTIDAINWDEADIVGFEWGTTQGGPYPNRVTKPGPFTKGDVFTAVMTDLPPQTTIYYRVIAHNESGWGYGIEKTLQTTTPTVITHDAHDISQNKASLPGEITDVGGADICDMAGAEWGYHSGLYTRSTVSIGDIGVESFDQYVYGFKPGSTVYYRAKAHSTVGWGYGEEKSFETLPLVLPTVGTLGHTNITEESATLQGEIGDTGGEYCDERGFEWGTEPGSYPNEVTESATFGTGIYSLDVTGLPSGGTIYYRAKAHNSKGWGYGPEHSFSTTQPGGAVGTAAMLVELLTD